MKKACEEYELIRELTATIKDIYNSSLSSGGIQNRSRLANAIIAKRDSCRELIEKANKQL